MAHHHGHTHAHPPTASSRRMAIALALLLLFMAAEVVAGIVASSLALLSDAAHMLTDVGALALALAAARLAARPARGAMTFGLSRSEILSAQINGATLLMLAALIGVEGVRRLFDPPDVVGGLVLVVAIVGIAVNLAAVWVLVGADRRALNVEGAFQHVLTDLYAFIGTAVAGAVVLWTGFDRADAIASLAVAGLMLRSAWGLLRASGRVLLEAAPAGVDPDAVGRAMAAEPGVVEVHDLHVWEITSGFPALSAHLLVAAGGDCHGARERVAAMLIDRYGIEHATLQVEHAPAEALLSIEDRTSTGNVRPPAGPA